MGRSRRNDTAICHGPTGQSIRTSIGSGRSGRSGRCTAELSRTWIKRGASGAAGPASAPPLGLGRPARHTPGHRARLPLISQAHSPCGTVREGSVFSAVRLSSSRPSRRCHFRCRTLRLHGLDSPLRPTTLDSCCQDSMLPNYGPNNPYRDCIAIGERSGAGGVRATASAVSSKGSARAHPAGRPDATLDS